MKRLSELSKGDQGIISSIEKYEVQVALMNLGVIVGDLLKLSDIAPLGDPIAFTVNHTKVSIRKNDARTIWVQL